MPNQVSNSTALDMWNGEGTPIAGQYLAPGLCVVRVFNGEYIVRNMTEHSLMIRTPGSSGVTVDVGSTMAIRVESETGRLVRGNYRTSYTPPRPRTAPIARDPAYTFLEDSVDSVPAPPAPIPTVDPRGPWRIPIGQGMTYAVDPINGLRVSRINSGLDYIQPHHVRRVSVDSSGNYVVYLSGQATCYPPSLVAYSRAYYAFVLMEDMTSSGNSTITVQRDSSGFYWLPEGESSLPVRLNWNTEGSVYAPLRDIQRYYSADENRETYLHVSAHYVHGIPSDSLGNPVGSQYPEPGTTVNSDNTIPNISIISEGDIQVTTSDSTLTEAKKQKQIRDLMEQIIATRSLKQAESLIQCGLEFEFHEINGKKRGEFGGELDDTKVAAGVEEYLLSNHGYTSSTSDFTRWLVSNRTWSSPARKSIFTGLIQGGLGLDSLKETLRQEIETDLLSVRNSYLVEIRNRITAGSGRTNFLKDGSNGISGWDRISAYTQLGDDGSVMGGEIRTVGPRSIPEFLTAAKVLSENNFTVAENTSLHIHLSVKGITHAYGARFQAEMYAYLLRNLHRVPDSVRKRMIAEKGCRSYAKLLLSTEKYSAIHFHKKYGTWEFRLFGNTNNYIEMRTCLQLAYEALKHAYSVKLGRSESLLGSVTTSQIQAVLEKLMANPEKFWDTLATDTKLVIEAGAA